MVDREKFGQLTVNVFMPIINNYIVKFNLPSMSRDDLRQEALMALWRSMSLYDPTKGSLPKYARGVVYRHINMVVGTALAKCRWAGPPLPIDLLEVGEPPSIPEPVEVNLDTPNFDRTSIAKRNWVKVTRRSQKRILMGNRLHISDQPHDLDFVREIIGEHALDPEPSEDYWTADDYWYEDQKYKRVVERYSWGCVLFLSNKAKGEHATIVYEENEPQSYGEALKESKALPWYSDLIKHFKATTPERPECFGHYTVDPTCDGGYNYRYKLMEAPCLWHNECRKQLQAPRSRSLSQLATELCEAIADVCDLKLKAKETPGCLVLQTLDRKNEKGTYLKYVRENGAKLGVLVLKNKRTNLAVGLAAEADAHELLEPVRWGRYKSAIKKLQTEEQFSAIIEVASQIVEQLKE